MSCSLFSLRGLIKHLRTLLPNDFDQLQTPLAVGVFGASGQFELVTAGSLPEAVAASCAIPFVFQSVRFGDPPQNFADGGVKDRLGLQAWSEWSDSNSAFVHLVGTSRKPSKGTPVVVSPIGSSEGLEVPAGRSLLVARTPKASASFLSLNDYQAQKDHAYVLTMKTLVASNKC